MTEIDINKYYSILEKFVEKNIFKSVTKKITINEINFTTKDYTFKKSIDEDKLYSNNEYRLYLPRGCSLIFVDDILVHILYGHPKFGYEGDYTENKKFVKRYYSRKENGQCGHISGFSINNVDYLIIGSKNVHLIVRKNNIEEDLLLYKDPRYIVASNITNLLNKKYSQCINEMFDFIKNNNVTFCCEAIFIHDQHIVDYYGLEELRFFAITKIRNDYDSSITWCNPEEAYNIFNILGLNTVEELICANNEEEWKDLSLKIRSDNNSEGGVISYVNEENKVVYVCKYKNDTYTFMRAVREQMRNNASNNKIIVRINNLHFEHAEKEKLTRRALQFNAYYTLLEPDQKTNFFSEWNNWTNKFDQLNDEEKDNLLVLYDNINKETNQLNVIMLVGIQGSGKSTIARLMKYMIESNNDTVHLEQDMFKGNLKLYNSEIKKAVQNHNIKYLILAKMNHTEQIRKNTMNTIEECGRNVNYMYLVLDQMDIDFYISRIKNRGKSHKSLFYDEKLSHIIKNTLDSYEPISDMEKSMTPTFYINPSDNRDTIIKNILNYMNITYDDDKFSNALTKVIKDDNDIELEQKNFKPKNPLYDCIKISSSLLNNIDIQCENHIIKKEFHITLNYYGSKNKPDNDFIENIETEVNIIGYVKDDKCISLLCKLEEKFNKYFINSKPHITYALCQDIKPVYSNELINNNDCILFNKPIIINGYTNRVY